jgi:hypothetical protein
MHWEEHMHHKHHFPRRYGGAAVLASAALLLIVSTASAADNQGNAAGDDRAVRLIDVIPIPGRTGVNATNGKLYSFDISWVDQDRQLYFLADRSNAAIDVVDTKTDIFVGQIPGGFAGVAVVGGVVRGGQSGPNGVVTGGHCLFATDAPSRVVSFDLNEPFPPPVVNSVSTGGADNFRADELAFQPDFAPNTGLLLVINPNDATPFGTFIKVNQTTCALTSPTAANRVLLDKAHGVDATGGAEQPVWDPATHLFYLSIPNIGSDPIHGGVVSIPPNGTSWTVLGTGIDFCNPNGLALGPKGNLFVGCSTVYDTAGNAWAPGGTVTAAPNDVIIAKDGSINGRVLGVGAGDEVWFNSGDGNYYATGSGSPFRPNPNTAAQGSTPLGVVDAKSRTVLQLVTTFNVPAVGTGNSSTEHPAGTAHSVAANAANNHIFVPLAANNAFSSYAVPGGTPPVSDCETGCVAVFAHTDEN